jgi:hypothetical protein
MAVSKGLLLHVVASKDAFSTMPIYSVIKKQTGDRFMSKDASFDIVSEFDQQELVNALDQARRDVNTRFDLKDTGATIEQEGDAKLIITAGDEFAARNIYDIVENKIVKRGLSPLILDPQKSEDALGGKVRMPVNLKKGQENRGRDQGYQAEGAAQHPGRSGPGLRQEPR